MPLTRSEIAERVVEVLCDGLGVDPEEVLPTATLIGDLGAKSLDFLDIVFRLAKRFDVKIPRGDLFPESLLSDPAYVSGGRFTETGLEQLQRQNLWRTNIDALRENPNVADLLTVQDVCDYVEHRLNS